MISLIFFDFNKLLEITLPNIYILLPKNAEYATVPIEGTENKVQTETAYSS